ncbi:MAG: sodium:solute symporter family transporter [Hyphomicrobiaceae bacterium]
MAAAPRSRLVNPLLGMYFGIFGSLLVAIVLLLMMLEQLGVTDATLRTSMIAGFLGTFCAVGIATFTHMPVEYFSSGRRVPAFFNGLVLAIVAIGGTGLTALSGSLFLIGFDALCIGVGLTGGLVCMVVLIVPFLRKFGAYSIPAYLSRRFDSQGLRVVSTALIAVPCLLLLMAEMKMAAFAASWLTQVSEGIALCFFVLTIVLVVAPGGLRSATWASAAAAIAAIVALMVPVVIVAVLTTNLPIPQVSHGPVLRALMRVEAAQIAAVPAASAFSFELPGAGFEPLLHRFGTPFASIGPAAFVLAALAVMIGIAGSPVLLSRAGATPGVYESRKSIGWAALLLGIVLLTLSAVAVFMRDIVLDQFTDPSQVHQAAWFATLANLGLGLLDSQAQPGTMSSLLFKRDGILIALPSAAGFPAVFLYLAAAGIVSAALVGACASVVTLGTMLAEDVVNGPRSELVSDRMRVTSARVIVTLCAIVAGWMAAVTRGDPLELLLWSLALSGSSIFPVLMLSIWWKRTNVWGALAGLVAGFAAAAGGIMVGEVFSFAVPGMMAGAVGAPVSFAAAVIVSVLTPAPDRHVLEVVRELRIPGGETLYDREVRLALLQRQRG